MIRQLLVAALYAAAGVIKGQRLLWDAVDDVTSFFVSLGDWADPGNDDYEDDRPDRCPAYVPEALVSDR